MRSYEIRHVIGFEETNLVGNVYYANYVLWQGRCREMFLHDHAPEILDELNQGLALVTTHVSCEFFNEMFAFDEVIIRMSIDTVVQNRINMLFDYLRVTEDGEEIIAKGKQGVACMRREKGHAVVTPIPVALRTALVEFGADGSLSA